MHHFCGKRSHCHNAKNNYIKLLWKPNLVCLFDNVFDKIVCFAKNNQAVINPGLDTQAMINSGLDT